MQKLLAFLFTTASAALLSWAAASSPPQERDLLQVLQSNAAPEEKAITCKRLAIYGSEASVPALKALLPDERLSSWARIALEAIPGPAADQALREALDTVQGRQLIGVINSIGVRRDQKAVPALAKKLNTPDPAIASAAAESLGRIGGSSAAKALRAALPKAPETTRGAMALGCVYCAEQFMAAGDHSQAVKLYDFVREAAVPKQRILEATRGAILARKAKGLPLLLEQLRSPDPELFGIGLRTARELPGVEVTKALGAEVKNSPAPRQPLILLALADREDPAALPAILAAAGSDSKALKKVAVEVLDRSGDPAALTALLPIASGSDPELATSAKNALGRLPGVAVNQEILNRLQTADAATRPVLIEVAARRGIESAVPRLLVYADSSDIPSRRAALSAIGAMGGDAEASGLVKLLETQKDADKKADLEKALLAIVSRRGAACAPLVMPLAKSTDPAARQIGLQALAAAGGPAALEAVKTATTDADEAVREEAVQTLCSWPNTWPEDSHVAEPLLALARSAEKPAHQVLASRAYLQWLLGDEKMAGPEKLRRLNDALPLLKRPEEKRMTIAVLRQVQEPEAVQQLISLASDASTAEEACSALVGLASAPNSKLPKAAREQALQAVLERAPGEALKQKAQDALKKLAGA
jgi:HEAT repeat protein